MLCVGTLWALATLGKFKLMERCTIMWAVAIKIISSTSVISTSGVTLIPKIASSWSCGALAMVVLPPSRHFLRLQNSDEFFSEAIGIDQRVFHPLLKEVVKRHA